MGKDCNFTNGCGIHIHNGTSCFNVTTQGGHVYNRTTIPIDPWLYTMYHATDANGNAYFSGCVENGVPSFIGNPFIVHSNNGTRVSCGILEGDAKNTFILIDPITDQPIGPLGTVNYTSLGTSSNLLNMEAKFVKPYKSARVTFDNPKRTFCEKATPFSVFSDIRGNFRGQTIPLGSHVVTATPYAADNCTGLPGNILSQTFDVVGCNIEYIARDVKSSKDRLFTIWNNTVSNARSAVMINIEANITCGFQINEVRFLFKYLSENTIVRRQIEKEAPYYLLGNRGRSISPGVILANGRYSISTVINGIDHGTIVFNFYDDY
jgi:hypothetical protein